MQDWKIVTFEYTFKLLYSFLCVKKVNQFQITNAENNFVHLDKQSKRLERLLGCKKADKLPAKLGSKKGTNM